MRPGLFLLLLVLCSCRLIVDPDQFRDDDGDAAAPDDDAGTADALTDGPELGCGEWQPRYVDFDLTQSPPEPINLLIGTYQLDPGMRELVPAGGGDPIPLQLMEQRTGPNVLLLWTESLLIEENVTINGWSTDEALPLVFAARSVITINGTIDVSSNLWAIPGPGADPLVCGEDGVLPRQAGADGSSSAGVNAGGGGGGGGFGEAGARGGAINDLLLTAGSGGSSIASRPAFIRGGCPGGAGGPGVDPAVAQGGRGGGAIHFLSCDLIEINVSGTIDASGGGGRGGGAGDVGGGGGGGSGGYIGLEAPTIRIRESAVLGANGGGGGGGSDTVALAQPGFDGEAGVTPASGGLSITGGGNGGAAEFAPTQGGGGDETVGGGGGGGGQGVLLLLGNDVQIDPAAVVSPMPLIEPLY